jgi:ATP-dependent Clp protease protease subunit
MLAGRVDHAVASGLAGELLLLDPSDPRPLQLHLSAKDGDLDACLVLADAFDACPVPIEARCVGVVGGPAVAVLAGASKRSAVPTCRFHLSEPRTAMTGRAEDVRRQAEAHWQQVHGLHRRLADLTGAPIEQIDQDLRHGRWLDAAEALAYGLVQEIEPPRGKGPSRPK